MKYNKLLLAACLASVAGIYACSDDGESGITMISCTSSDQCTDGKICLNGRCVAPSDSEEPDDPSKTDPDNPDDPQGQNKPDPSRYPDKDGDTIPDVYDSCDEDTDGDGTPNCEDSDSDNDTIPDSIEALNGGDVTKVPYDTDGDGVYDFLEKDSDKNGIPDTIEVGPDPLHPVDTDGDGIPDYQSYDNDGDDIYDEEEITGILAIDDKFGSHYGRLCGDTWCEPGNVNHPWDSDGDTIPDYMDKDSDGDGLPDEIEGYLDTDGDGVLDIYDTDSDNDTIPDGKEVDSSGNPLVYVDEVGKQTYCFQSVDCDGDGLADTQEISCPGMNGIANKDQDGDGYPDGAEYVAAQYAMAYGSLTGVTVSSVEDFICNKDIGVKDVFEFFFELKYGGEAKNDLLIFEPKVKKLDLVFNVDTTNSMTNAINNVKSNIGKVIEKIRAIVPDSGFGLTNFDDFPVGDCHVYPYPINLTLTTVDPMTGAQVETPYPNLTVWHPCGIDTYRNVTFGDRPFRLLGTISTDAATVTSYTQNALFTTRHGADGAESGVESLYQIATGAGVSWNSGSNYGAYFPQIAEGLDDLFMTYSWIGGSIEARRNAPNTWGGVDFRKETLPVVIHTTDVYSHDKADGRYISHSYPEFFTYSSTSVPGAHYSSDLIPVLQNKGIRVITLNVISQDAQEYGADQLGQMTLWSRESNAVVPACAFDCLGKCCLGDEITEPVTINGRDNQCVLAYKANMSDVSETVVNGVDALVKYGTYTVATRIRGEAIEGSTVDTSCFIKQVVATEYVAPPSEPEHSCNPTANPIEVANAGYNNGFENFAPGTSSESRKGSELHYTVIAQNDNCVPPKDVAQVFTAYIDVYDPTTGVSFGERKVSIIVPPESYAVN